MNDETLKLINYLNEISDKSNSGELEWIQLSPTSYRWRQESTGLTVTIQKAEVPRSGSLLMKKALELQRANNGVLDRELFEKSKNLEKQELMFQVNEENLKQNLLTLSTKERPELYEPLAKIFEGAEKTMVLRANDVLRRLLMN